MSVYFIMSLKNVSKELPIKAVLKSVMILQKVLLSVLLNNFIILW